MPSTSSSVTVTAADNGGAVSLHPGDTLAVRLEANPSTGYSWHALLAPDGLFSLAGAAYEPTPRSPGSFGGGGVQELRFVVGGEQGGGSSQGGWLRLLSLRPFAPGVEGAELWEIQVTVAPA
jgi:predicted secreted protein